MLPEFGEAQKQEALPPFSPVASPSQTTSFLRGRLETRRSSYLKHISLAQPASVIFTRENFVGKYWES